MHLQPTHQTHAQEKHVLMLTMLTKLYVVRPCYHSFFSFKNEIKELFIFLEETKLHPQGL